jgi:hypothetical protein
MDWAEVTRSAWARSPSRSPSRCEPGTTSSPHPRVRPGAGQPVPRLRPARHRARRPPGPRHDPPPDHGGPPHRDGAHPKRRYQRYAKARWYAFTKMQTGSPSACAASSRCRRTASTTSAERPQGLPEKLYVVPVGVDPELFRPLEGVERRPRQIISTASADVAMKGQRYLLEALAKLRTEYPELKLDPDRPPQGRLGGQRTIEELGLPTPSSSCPACPTSASSSSTTSRPAPWSRRSTRASPCRRSRP